MINKLSNHVYHVQKINSPAEQYALKIVEHESEAIVKENTNMTRFKKHPNIVRVYQYGRKGYIKKPNGKTTKNDLVYIKMQLMQGGTFTQFLKSIGGRLTEKEARFFFGQILDGISYIHE